MRRSFSLRLHLMGLVAAVLVPSLIAGGTAAWRLASSYREAFEERLQDTASALALFVESEIETYRTIANSLALSPMVEGEDLSAFREWARSLTAPLGSWVVVHEMQPTIRRLLNTATADDAVLATGPGPLTFRALGQALETRRVAVSDFIIGGVTGRPIVVVAAPVIRNGEVTRIVSVAVDLVRLSERLHARAPGGETFASVADSGGRIVARSRNYEQLLGVLPPSRAVPETARSQRVFEAAASDGGRAIFSGQHIANLPGWTIVVAEPHAGYRASWLTPLLTLIAGGLAAVLLGVAAAAWVANRITRPVQAMMRHADAVADRPDREERPSPPAIITGVLEFERLQHATERAEMALEARALEYQAIFDTAAAGVAEVDAATLRYVRVNRRFCEIVGREEAELVGHLVPDDLVHPEDRGRTPATLARRKRRAIQVEGRVMRPDRKLTWVRASASVILERGTGRPLRILTILQDITERRQAEEARALLAGEVDHRAKNALAVVLAAVRLTPKTEVEAYARAIEGRVAALARTHALLADARWTGADLQALVEGELAPFLAPSGGPQPRARLSGPPLVVAAEAAQTISLLLHELATNATKYGALSVPGGTVEVSWERDDAAGLLCLRWTERNGPPAEAPKRQGFGTRVINRLVEAQRDGSVERHWAADGFSCVVTMGFGSAPGKPGTPRPPQGSEGQKAPADAE
ncbi:HWE histidine kinase domain-containing protein [Sabulicella rubraurantiaca]|uniref:HWE histidine kinase domain-containing protein n=1 Tax=Sabulicella rubraurantiaca TaxID=2811429 RepID=UPI001A96C5ED|nr:HWE histidine kinase domain-containing protein [Sabulicella rubraurantiaca]